MRERMRGSRPRRGRKPEPGTTDSEGREPFEEFIEPFRTNFRETTLEFVRSLFTPGADDSLVSRVAHDMAAAPPEVAVAALESSFMYAAR